MTVRHGIRFEVPGRVPSMNDLIRLKGANKRAYNARKKAWDMLVATSAGPAWRAFTAYYSAWRGPAKISIHIVEPNRKRDPDNVAAAARKFVHDGLVKAHVIAGDGWAHVVPDLHTTLEVGHPPRIEVLVGWEEADAR